MVRGSLKRFNLKDDWRVIRINDTWLFGRNLSKISQQQWESFCCLQSLLCLAVAFWRALDKQLYPQGSINVVSLISAQPYLMDATDVPECLVAGDKNTHTHTKNSILLSGWFEGVCVWDAILSEALSFTLRYNISQKDIFMKNDYQVLIQSEHLYTSGLSIHFL